MKRIIKIIPLIFLIFALASCDSGQKVKVNDNLSTTDLSSVTVDGIKVGDSIKNIDFSEYIISDSYGSKEDFYAYDEMRITTDDSGCIVEIWAEIYMMDLNIKESNDIKTIDEVAELLGSDYNNYWFDREQGLKANTYIDKDNSLNVTFVYSANTGTVSQLVWVIFSKQV